MQKKIGFVSIVGKPNSGKSTLLNSILKQKISIVTPKENTTRNLIRGIYNDGNSQLIFQDTPGFLKSNSILEDKMKSSILSSFNGVDVILFLLQINKSFDIDYINSIELLKQSTCRKILLLTKSDLVDKVYIENKINELSSINYFDKIISISSIKNKNIDSLIEQIKVNLNEGHILYDESDVVDVSEKFMVAEFIRESLLLLLNNEVPHQAYVTVDKMDENDQYIDISAIITLSRNSLKGIVIGKNGVMIKKIGIQSREKLESLFNKKINLKLFVRVRKKWQNNNNVVNLI